jgi:hypothetical protein
MRNIGKRFGYHVVPRHFYSPLPDLDELPDDVYDRVFSMGGVAFGEAAQLELLEGELRDYVAEFPEHGPPGYDFENGGYESIESELLYAIIRRFKPRRVLEVGTGFSTLITSAAGKVNAAEGSPLHFISVDPDPTGNTSKVLDPSVEMEQRPVRIQDVPPEDFEALESGDIFFIDGTHQVRLDSDVNFVVLEVLPRLKPGVIVHAHDIYLPYEYPRYFVERFYWTEQYLLHAFLACNPSFEVMLASHFLTRAHPGRVASIFPSFDRHRLPSAFWLRRR